MEIFKDSFICEDEEIFNLYKKNLLKGMNEDDAYIEAQSEIFCKACKRNGMFEGGDRDYR